MSLTPLPVARELFLRAAGMTSASARVTTDGPQPARPAGVDGVCRPRATAQLAGRAQSCLRLGTAALAADEDAAGDGVR